ncbi:hypothetical protein UCRNP2_4064 [Neofusicoccum parvum UCRNP2]|uniref:Uncharacterized protein n=1 Tax=Botryosphaeria parva (strain UCR-NP2) TaxID=1287680 RepID=R1GLF3_BOTPV|nr:hypothetical protein UCRNP2_4064 [Neofusicoccum parvum UCRNP2]
MQPSQSQQRPPSLTKEQFNSLTQQQQLQYRQSMLQAAQAQGNKQLQGNNAPQGAQQDNLKQQFTAMMQESMRTMNLENKPHVDVPPEARAQMAAEIQKAGQWITKLDQIMFMDWVKHRNNDRSKHLISVRHMLHSQLDSHKRLKEHLTITPQAMQKIIQQVVGFIKQVMVENQGEKAQPQPGGQDGFEAKDELDLHIKDAHAKVEDPLKFAIENVAEGLGLNPDGTPKQAKMDINANIRGRPAPSMSKQPMATKPGQTPQIKAEAGTPATGAGATPMNRVPTQTGMKSSPSASFKTPQAAIKAQTPGSSGAPAMNRTPSKAAKDANKPADAIMEDQIAPKPTTNPWDECPISPSQLHFMFADEDLAKQMLEMSNSSFIAKEDLEREEQEKNQEKVEPRSTTPATTPSPASTKDSKETGSSDISENDKLNITIAGDDAEWNQRALEADVDFSSMMDSLFVLDDSNNMTLPQNEDNQEMTGPYGFWRDSLGTGDDKIPNWEATELGATYDFLNAPPAPTDEQDLKDLFGITTGMDSLEDLGMAG